MAQLTRLPVLPICLIAICLVCAAHSAEKSNIILTDDHALTIRHLRTEYLTNPVGLEETAPRFSWILVSEQRGAKQHTYRIQVSSTPDGAPDLWDSGTVQSAETVNVVYEGKPLKSRQQCFWTVTVNGVASEQASWTMGLLDAEDWTAEWISFKDDTPLTATQTNVVLPAPRHYRKPFSAGKAIQRATVYATALGLYELSINGQPVTDQMFTPGWSDYRKRVYYNTFDVTGLVQKGKNAVGAIVADGWYSGYVGFGLLAGLGPNNSGRYFYGKTPALRVQMEIEYEDGTTETVITDPSWKTSEGPIRESDMLMGEVHDARREMPGWDAPEFDDDQWQRAILAKKNGSLKAPYHDKAGDREVELGFIEPEIVQAYSSVPIRPIGTIRPVALTEPEPGVYIFDMGQNFSGIVELSVRGERGTKVQVRHGEMLHPNGTLMTENLRTARATDTYVLSGGATETWRPKFTYHGFQFVEITGLPKKPTLDTIKGIVIHSDTALTSSFESSDPVVNQLFSNIVWTQRANFFEVPTDCPQRDERLGWTGDAAAFIGSATYNADVAAFFTKWERDLVESQRKNGAYPAYAPFPMTKGNGSAYGTAWMDAGIICPYTIYKVYGDTRMIEQNYASMTEFMEFRKKRSPNFQGVVDGNTWGDWLAPLKTPIEYIDAVYFAYTSDLMAEMANAIGKTADADKYTNWGRQIRNFFNRNYVNDDGSLAVNTQTAYALALSVDMLPPGKRIPAGQHLAKLIEDNDNLMATGFIGSRPLLPVLTATGHHDLAVRLLQNRRYPSWGFEVVNGATSIWERWNSFTIEDGFGDAKMNSFSHYAFGAVCEWMFKSLVGIDTDGTGYKHIVLRPGPPSADSNPDHAPIHWVKAEYDSIRGKIAVDWKQNSRSFQYKVTIPANTIATLYLPASSADKVTESGNRLKKANGVNLRGMEGTRVRLALESGTYQFVVGN